MTTHIRVSDVVPLIQAVADGVRTTYPFPFPIFRADDLEVWANATVVSSGYTVLGEGSSTGGAVIFADAPASGVRVTLRRRQTYARTEDFLDERAPTPHELNDAVDQNVAAIQELAEEVARAVKRPLAADLSHPLDLSLPAPEAGKVIGWNGSANALVNLTQVDVSDMLRKSQNLADLPDKAQARINLELAAVAHSGSYADLSDKPNLATVALSGQYADLSGKPTLGSAASHAATDFATAAQGAKADNAVQPSALGSAASHAATDFATAAQGAKADNALLKDNRLSEFGTPTLKAEARVNLGLGNAATKDVGTSSGTVAAGDHSHAGLYEPVDSTILRTPAIGVTVQGYDVNTVKKNVANTFSAPQSVTVQALTDAATVTIPITAQVWTLSTTARRSIAAPTGGVAGTFYFLLLTTNGFTPLSWDSAFDFGAAGVPVDLSGICGFDLYYDGTRYRISTRFTGGA